MDGLCYHNVACTFFPVSLCILRLTCRTDVAAVEAAFSLGLQHFLNLHRLLLLVSTAFVILW